MDDSGSAAQRFTVIVVELSDGLGEPGAFRGPGAVANRYALRCDGDIELAAVGGMRLAFDESAFIESGNGGAHRLGPDAFGAGEIGGGSRPFDLKTAQDRGLGEREFVARGRGANTAHKQSNGLDEVGGGCFEGLARHRETISD